MSDYYVFPAPDSVNQNKPKITQTESNEAKNSANKALMFIGITLLVVTVSGISYYLGTKSGVKKADSSATPTSTLTQPLFETPSPSQRPSEPEATITPTINLTPSPSPKITPTPKQKTKILSSTAGLDGFRSSDSSGDNTKEIKAGKNQSSASRGFISFDLTEIPKYEHLEKAQIKLYQAKVEGNPYSNGNLLKIDHLTYGDALDKSDYAMPALLSNITTLSKNKNIEWKTANVTEQVLDDIANARSFSQFRIHFENESAEGDSGENFAIFDSANDYPENSNHPPQLVIKYY